MLCPQLFLSHLLQLSTNSLRMGHTSYLPMLYFDMKWYFYGYSLQTASVVLESECLCCQCVLYSNGCGQLSEYTRTSEPLSGFWWQLVHGQSFAEGQRPFPVTFSMRWFLSHHLMKVCLSVAHRRVYFCMEKAQIHSIKGQQLHLF